MSQHSATQIETTEPSFRTYIKTTFKYYFQPKGRSLIAVLYFVFFAYFALFYLGNALLAIRFVWNTLGSPTASMGPEYVVWGSIFVVNLLVPMCISILAIVIPSEMKKRVWPRSTRIVLAAITGVLFFNIIIVADSSLNYVEHQAPIKAYLDSKNIPLKTP